MKRRGAHRWLTKQFGSTARTDQEVAWPGWLAPEPTVELGGAPQIGPDGDDHGLHPPPRLYANGALERAAAAYRQAQVDVQGWATLELRIRYRALKRQAGHSTLNDVGHACLRAVTNELGARGEQTPRGHGFESR